MSRSSRLATPVYNHMDQGRMSIPSVSSANHNVIRSSVKNSALWTALRHIKHQFVLRFAKRQNRIYTQFCRFPHQFRAVVEKVVPRLRPAERAAAVRVDPRSIDSSAAARRRQSGSGE